MSKKLEIKTREEALKLHKEMWEEMNKSLGHKAYPHNPSGLAQKSYDRIMFKEGYCRGKGISIKHDCFLCEFACQEYFRNHPEQCDTESSPDIDYCQYCPANWCSECTIQLCEESGFMCECDCPEGYNLDWRKSSIEDIANIEERKEQ